MQSAHVRVYTLIHPTRVHALSLDDLNKRRNIDVFLIVMDSSATVYHKHSYYNMANFNPMD